MSACAVPACDDAVVIVDCSHCLAVHPEGPLWVDSGRYRSSIGLCPVVASYNSLTSDRSMAVEKRTFIGMVEAGEPLIQQAVDAMRQYHEAETAGRPIEEVEHLRLLAESLFQAVADYQLRVMAKARGKDLPPLH